MQQKKIKRLFLMKTFIKEKKLLNSLFYLRFKFLKSSSSHIQKSSRQTGYPMNHWATTHLRRKTEEGLQRSELNAMLH